MWKYTLHLLNTIIKAIFKEITFITQVVTENTAGTLLEILSYTFHYLFYICFKAILTSYYKLGDYLSDSVCVTMCVRLYVSAFRNGSFPNLEGTFYGHATRPYVLLLIFWWILSKCGGDACATYYVCSRTARADHVHMCAFAYLCTDYLQTWW
jgi:hypothetical protein